VLASGRRQGGGGRSQDLTTGGRGEISVSFLEKNKKKLEIGVFSTALSEQGVPVEKGGKDERRTKVKDLQRGHRFIEIGCSEAQTGDSGPYWEK